MSVASTVEGTPSVCPCCGAALPGVILDPGRFDEPPRLPARRWELTAPESYLLRYGPGRDVRPVSAFKLAMMDLVARGALTVNGVFVRRRWVRGTRAVWLLGDGPRKASVDEPALLPLILLHSSMIERRPSFAVSFVNSAMELPGVPLERFVSAVARRNGGYAAYMRRDVAGSLRNRELISGTNRHARHTPAGEQAWERLDQWVEVGGDPLQSWMRDQTWLRAYLAGAGAAVFLAEIEYASRQVLRDIGLALARNPPADQQHAGAEIGGVDLAGLADSLGGLFDGAFRALDNAFVGPTGGGGDG